MSYIPSTPPPVPYGYELILDLHGCDASTFNRKSLRGYFEKLCDEIQMEREGLHFWDYDGVPDAEITTEAHLLGTSAVQFIKTSNVVIHTLDLLQATYVNIFSCKKYDAVVAQNLTQEWFGAATCRSTLIERI